MKNGHAKIRSSQPEIAAAKMKAAEDKRYRKRIKAAVQYLKSLGIKNNESNT